MYDNHGDLIERMFSGDTSSFNDILLWYAEDVLRLAWFLLHDREEAEDILQETMLTLVRLVKEKKIRSANGSIKGLLLRCTRNLCIDRLRKKMTFYSLDDEENPAITSVSDLNTPERAAEQSRLFTALDHGLSDLSDIQRTILILFELNGESYQQIADSLQLPLENVRKYLYRARKKLETYLAPYRGVL